MFELIPFNHTVRRVPSYDPFREMQDFERSFFNNVPAASGTFRTDVIDNGESYELQAELPGFRKEDISLNVENDCLTITAERKFTEEEKNKNFIKQERFYGSYSRSFDVSAVTVDAIEASYEDGVLKLVMPKKAEVLPASRKLEIK